MSSIECPTLTLDLDQAPSQRVQAIDTDAVARCRDLFNAMLALMPPTTLPIADMVRMRTEERFHDEALGLARHHGVDWRQIIVANVSYDLFLGIGCSTAAIPAAEGPILARNMDWMPVELLARATYRMRCSRGGRHAFTHAGWPGSIGVVTGLSAHGFAVALNAVSSPEGVNLDGYPVLLFLRTVLEDARSFEDALARLTHQPLVMSALFTLIGTRNDQRVVIERSPTRHALRWGEEGVPLLATNHYRALYAVESSSLGEEGCSRYERLCGLLHAAGRPQQLSDPELLAMLSDQGVMQPITAQQIVARPAQDELKVYIPRHLAA